jgi:hypothetical protein
MRIKKMPFEHNSFILSKDNGNKGLDTREWNEVAEWLTERKMKFNMQGGILTLYREMDCTLFTLRWISE